MRHAKRWLYLVHRWLGVLLCSVFALWFVSGIVMMYVGYPKLTPAERLEHLPPMRGVPIALEPAQALQAAGLQGPLQELRLALASGGRPVYVATPATDLEPGSKAARRSKTAPVVIDATTGELIRNVSAAHALASAQTFASSRGSALVADAYPQHLGMVGEDAFTHSRALDMHRPLHTVALGDADDTVVYVSNATGEVVRDATRTERLWNYAGAWIHWLYPFRGNVFDRYWTDIVNWLSIAGIVLALTGTVVGVLRWRFTGARYKSGSRSPYPGGMMKWHHTTGLLFAGVTITWVFSGLMSMNPWKLFDSGAPPLRTAAMHGGPLQLASGPPLASVKDLLAQATPNVRELRTMPSPRRSWPPQPHAWWTRPYRKCKPCARMTCTITTGLRTPWAVAPTSPCPCGGWCLPTRMPPGCTSTHARAPCWAAPTPTAAPAAGCFPCCTAGTGCPCWSAARCGTWC